MSIAHSQLARLGVLMTLALVLASIWLGATEPAVAQPRGKVSDDPLAIPDRDQKVMQALNSFLRIDFKGKPMRAALDFLEEKTNGDLCFMCDEIALRAAEIETAVFNNDPVVETWKNVRIRKLLNTMLGARKLGYYLDDGTLMIAPREVVDKKLIARNYPAADLVGGRRLVAAATDELRGGGQVGPVGRLLSSNVDALAQQIMGFIAPEHWKINGGPGTMTFVPASASLQVRCSLEVHYLIAASGVFDSGRKTDRKADPAPAPQKFVVIKAYDLAGLVDARNDSSRAELIKAISLAVASPDGKDDKLKFDPASMTILSGPQLLIVRQAPEVHERIETFFSMVRSARPRSQLFMQPGLHGTGGGMMGFVPPVQPAPAGIFGIGGGGGSINMGNGGVQGIPP